MGANRYGEKKTPMMDRIQWLGHGSFIIQGNPLIYINPWRVARGVFHADVILISHHHYDHCSLADIEKLRGSHTRIIGSRRVAEQIPGCEVLRPWQSISVDRTSIKGIPAYSTHNGLHPIEDGGLGFVISQNFHDLYYAGDTDLIPEMERIRPDIALLPIDGNGTMTVESAVEAVRIMQPKHVIPYNWGTYSGGATLYEARSFERQLDGIANVAVMELVR